jgi:phage terminase large subunit-like protein
MQVRILPPLPDKYRTPSMKLETLRGLVEEAKTDPHYQFKDLTEAELWVLAKKSFSRLTENQALAVHKQWLATLKQANEPVTKENEYQFILYRFLAQTNLFFLCRVLEKYGQVTRRTHEDICNAFFVQKNPTLINFEAFALQYTDLRDRMLLVPRGGFKSSIDIADCVQWVINFPEVTILILTGVYQLASDFLGELRQHFTFDELAAPEGKTQYGPKLMMNKATGEWSQSLFQALFPEHCIPAGEGKQFEFQTPASKGGDAREPTIRAASIEQALSGMHFGVLKLDDVVTNENSLTSERLEKINKQISVNRAMLHPHGFNDVIGTWYDEHDYYGITIKQEETFAAEEGLLHNIQGSVDSGRFNSSVYVKVYLRSGWWTNEEATKAGKIETELTKSDLDLWFPERLTYEFLTKEKKKDKDGFAIKYLNNPRTIHRIKFPRELLVRRTVPHNQLPPSGIMVTVVDTAYSVKQWADYTVILTANIYGGRFYVVNMVRGRFNEYELPAVIAMAGQKWKPKRIAIEDSVGVKWMGRELIREMDKLSIKIPIEYVTLGYGTKLRSKQLKAKPVLRLLGDERLIFSNSCEGLAEIYNELERFTGSSSDVHDDIVSALSLLVEQFGAYAEMVGKSAYNESAALDRLGKARHDQIYGVIETPQHRLAYSYAEKALGMDENPVTAFQVDQSIGNQVPDIDTDPLADLF